MPREAVRKNGFRVASLSPGNQLLLTLSISLDVLALEVTKQTSHIFATIYTRKLESFVLRVVGVECDLRIQRRFSRLHAL